MNPYIKEYLINRAISDLHKDTIISHRDAVYSHKRGLLEQRLRDLIDSVLLLENQGKESANVRLESSDSKKEE